MANARHSALPDIGSARHDVRPPGPPSGLVHWLPGLSCAQKNGIARRHSPMATPTSLPWRDRGGGRVVVKRKENWACPRGLAPSVSALFDPHNRAAFLGHADGATPREAGSGYKAQAIRWEDRMSAGDRQTELLKHRLQAIGIARRDMVKLIAGVAGTAWWSRERTAGAQPAPGERLAKNQVIRLGGGGYFDRDPSAHDFGKTSGGGHAALFSGLLQLDPDFMPMPDVATRVEPNRDGSRWTFHLRNDARWSDGAACTAHDFAWSWRRLLDPATRASYSAFFYDIKNAEAYNKGQ